MWVVGTEPGSLQEQPALTAAPSLQPLPFMVTDPKWEGEGLETDGNLFLMGNGSGKTDWQHEEPRPFINSHFS